MEVLGGYRCRWGFHDSDYHKIWGAPDGGIRIGGWGHQGGVATHQRAQTPGTEEKLRCRVLVEVVVPLIPPLEGQHCDQVTVIWQAAHSLSRESCDITAEWTNQGIRRRLTQVQDLQKAFGAKSVAALQYLWPATP